MLTPAFELSQTEGFLIIKIKAPFAKISETEVFVDESEFKFYSKPYYLRLNLPGKIVENGGEKAQYDSDAGMFTLTFPKQIHGEVFEGLDMLTKLLAPSGGQSAQQPIIEILGGSTDDGAECEAVEDQDEEEEFDWQIEQEAYSDISDSVQLNSSTYGFGNFRSGVFERLQTELHDIIDLPDADHMTFTQRRSLRITDEQQHFEDDHYLSDLHENSSIMELLSYQPPWVDEYRQINDGVQVEDVVKFTDEEKEKMRKLPRKEFILDAPNTKRTLLSLVDLIFSYCYNNRTTEGENTVESGWTTAKLSATLSWLESFTSVKDVVVTSCRRSLCYPLYRHWELTCKVLRDTQKIFTIGKRRILKCLLEIHGLLMQSEQQYILNDLYITDYCVWVQGVRSRQIESLARSLRKIKVTKEDMDLDLNILEEAANLAMEEQLSTDEITDRVQNLNMVPDEDQSADLHPANELADRVNDLNITQKPNTSIEVVDVHSDNMKKDDRNEELNHVDNSVCDHEDENCDCQKSPERHMSSDSSDSSSDSCQSDSETSSSEYTTDSEQTDSDDSYNSEPCTTNEHASPSNTMDSKSNDVLQSGVTSNTSDDIIVLANPMHRLNDDTTLNF